ncbi:methyltransferase-like protein 22 isoform X1 [Daktulosphaira vitifoliae]|uniref:methyltransferase-like protein 22 isoform X1 n=1 Tax=Daktulosphaira vitifoliae TaxID=58002 RepID=UPI0021AA0F86|nr:methyltransferase-like protein 22 isoform X1 [Daktulosphaira vitifoliae]
MERSITLQSEVFQEMNESNESSNSTIHNVRSSFKFSHSTNTNPQEILVDEDGDLLLQRKSNIKEVVIEHFNRSPLDLVGMQVWRSALLMSDFIMYRRDIFNYNQVVLELGSGVGMTGIVLAMHCKETIFTDVNNKDILSNIKKNINLNKDLIIGHTTVLPLDFKEELFSELLREKLKDVKIIIAADVVYDNEITKQFINTVRKLMTITPDKTTYIGLEKRYIFSTTELDICAPCYDFFIELLNKASWCKLELLDCNFTQYFHYNRVKELVLLKLTVQKP